MSRERCLAEARELEVVLGGRRVLSVDRLCVPEARLTAVVGPNGSGKTTLLKTVAGLIKPSRGTVRVAGTEIHRLPPRQRALLAAYTPPLPPQRGLGQTVLEFAAASLYPRHGLLGLEAPRQALQEAARALERLEIDGLAGRSLLATSSGEAQRAMIAHALARNAPLTLLDEPTSFQDLRGRLLVYMAARSLARRGHAAVMATHDYTLASLHADHVVLIHRGRVVAQGPPGEVLTPERVETVYRVRVVEAYTPDGRRTLIPVEPL